MEEDNRFSHLTTDPKFRRIPKGERKVKVDKRFKSMFKSKQFKVKYTVDKRGRPVNHTSSEDLKRYYELSSGTDDSEEEPEINESSAGKYVQPAIDEDENSNEDENNSQGKYVRAPKLLEDIEVDESQNFVSNDKPISKKIKKKLRNLNVDYARGEANLVSDSSSDDGSSEAESEESDVEHAWGELDRDAEYTDEETNRLAICNMDWDRIKAVDLMVLLSSFLPPGGIILSLKIYPSEFGLQRLKEEEINGPTELTEKNCEEDAEGEEGSKYHMEKLRQYQLNRLKYYYAVLECDSVTSATKLYSECDGLEYESSATKMDLRYIPNDMQFDQQPKEICEKLPEPGKYQPRFFTTTALQQAKVNLTWDETNPDRIEITQKLGSGNIDDVSDGDLQAYLASSSDEDVETKTETQNDDNESDLDNKKTSLDKYKLLLEDINQQEKSKKEKDVEMEITWGIDLKDKTKEMVKKKLEEKEDKTPFQKYLDKRKEKRKQKREDKRRNSDSDSSIPPDVDMDDPYFAEEFKNVKQKKDKKEPEPEEDSHKNAELELLLLNHQDNKKHFSLSKIQERENNAHSKKKNKPVNEEVDDFEVNVKDPRFSALYSSHHYNLDPTDPHYKKTQGMEAIKNEKFKRRNLEPVNSDGNVPKQDKRKDAALSVLVKSVKRKTEALSNKNKKKRF